MATTVNLAPAPINTTQFIPGGNTPASGALLFSYIQGSTTKQNTFTDSTGATARTNPIVLDSGGNIPGSREVWIPSGLPAKFVLAPSNDTDPPASPYWSVDNLTGINDTTATQVEWIGGPAPTFINGTSFSLVGDQTLTFTVNRRVKSTNTAGTIYSTISASVFTSLTTVTVTNDSGTLDSGLSAVFYGLIPPTSNSLPTGAYTVTVLTATTGNFTVSASSTPAIKAISSSGTNGATITLENLVGSGGNFRNWAITTNFNANGSLELIPSASEGGNALTGTSAFKITGTNTDLLTSTVRFPNISTTAVAANATLNVVGSNDLLRSTSSRRYKTAIESLSREEAIALLLKLNPITYSSLCEADDPSLRHSGLIAEDVHELNPIFVSFSQDETGNKRPESVQYERLTAPLIAGWQAHEERLAALEERIKKTGL